MSVVVMCDDCWEVIGPVDRLFDAGPEPHRCEACRAELEDDE